MSNRKQLHGSNLNMAFRCMEQLRRRVFEGDIIPPAALAIAGTGTHKSVAVNMEHKKETGDLLSEHVCADAARDGVNKEWEIRGATLTEEQQSAGVVTTRGQMVDRAVRLARLHRTQLAPHLMPERVEYEWGIRLPDPISFDLVGTLDLQEASGCVRDTKTTSSSPAKGTADCSLQLTIYALARKALDGAGPVISVALDHLVDLKKAPKAVTQTSTRNTADFEGLLRRIEVVDRSISAGVFLPANPSDWWCSPRWCGYYSTCPYVRRTVVGVGP